MITALGYIAAILIGISLGLIGGGGSILTIPVLVYLFGVQPLLATGYSLFIVGSTSLVGAVKNYRKGNVNIKTALTFSIVSTITVLVTRKFLLHIIPDNLFTIMGYAITKSLMTMLLFAVVMMIAAVKMIVGTQPKDCPECAEKFQPGKIIYSGLGIGLLTGLLGAGGGFLIIPALIFLFHLSVKQAIGTSLLIIAINNLLGFTGDIFHTTINWGLLLSVTALAVAGIFIGSKLGEKIHGEKLKKGFGWFVLIMGIYIIIKEIAGL
ncbi:sulfite exporter TauE/SafE family protein [Panacibacter ginsenosidivorans]|uniref:sulfite exporter TauE/SafE family protein n=1 Tax=Panacibacter ginsenosidivorans TaxID=1813871 RepID=UPI001CEF9595|nr:sulfite exporter TauE/SafE family protein [Panacibacter ginsenosidivorans]